MQLRILAASTIFVGSYLPLSLILLAQDFDYSALNRQLCYDWPSATAACALPLHNPLISIGIFVVCLGCFVLTLGTLAVVPTKRTIEIREAKYIPAELTNYVLPYVVSFMSIDYRDTGKFVGLIVFLTWTFWITFRSGQIILNPLLIAFGWRPYEVTYTFPGSGSEHQADVLANTRITPGERHRFASLQDVIIIKSSTT